MTDPDHVISGGVYGQRGVLVRGVYVVVACAVWCLTLGGRLRRRSCVVLCYHGVNARQQEGMKRHLRIARSKAIRLDQADSIGVRMGKPSVCFTFDDAFANLHDHMLPAASEWGVPVEVFAVPGNLGRTPEWYMREGHPERVQRLMTAEELRRAADIPVCRIGSHTTRHAALGSIPQHDAEQELIESKDAVEQIVGRAVSTVAAPFGSWTPSVASVARRVGYTQFLTLDPTDTGVQPGVVGRYLMTPETSALEFCLTIDGAYRWVFALRRVVRKLKRAMRPAQNNSTDAPVTSNPAHQSASVR